MVPSHRKVRSGRDEFRETSTARADGNPEPSRRYTAGRCRDYLSAAVALNNRLERPAPHRGEEIVHSLRKRRGKVNPLVLGSSPSGPTNLRCAGTIGNDRGGTAFGSKHWKSRCIGLELAYKRWSLAIAEDRGQPDILGVTSGVTLGAQFELPRCMRLTQKIAAQAVFRLSSFGFPDVNSISCAELKRPAWMWADTGRRCLSTHCREAVVRGVR